MLIIKYINVGFFITMFVLIDIIVSTLYYFIKFISYGFIYISYFFYKFLQYESTGFLIISRFVYLFIRYVVLGTITPFVIISRIFIKINEINEKMLAKQQMEQEKKALAKERNRIIKEENKKRLEELKQKEKEKEKQAKKEAKEKEKQRTKADIYINENVVLEKKSFSDYLNDIFLNIGKLPSKIKEVFTNNRFIKNCTDFLFSMHRLPFTDARP